MIHGTTVLWECLDRVVGEAKTNDQKAQADFLETVKVVQNHLAMVFHRFLEKRDCLKIWIERHPVKPWNPFLNDEQATQIGGEYNNYLTNLRHINKQLQLSRFSENKVQQRVQELLGFYGITENDRVSAKTKELPPNLL